MSIQQDKRPNIVLVLADSMRARNVSCYGYHRRTTPRIDALAGNGVRFANAFVQAPFTVASAASILTGVYPSIHGLQHYGERLADSLITFPELLQAAGYHTAAFVANPHINRDSGMTRGFIYFTDGRPWYKRPRPMSRFASWAESGKALNRDVSEQLRRKRDEPFFFLVFYNDSHIPYSDLARVFLPWVGKKFHSPDFERISYTDDEVAHVTHLYDRALQRADRRIGEMYDLVQRAPTQRENVFLISADHGEGLDRRFERAGHGRLYENGIHVPLVVHAPAITGEPRVVDRLVTSLDIAPTICELAGIDSPHQFQGKSLLPVLQGSPLSTVQPHVISEYHDSRAVRTAEWKLIQRGAGIGSVDPVVEDSVELYEVQRDAWEEVDVAHLHPGIVAELTEVLRNFVADINRDAHLPSSFEEDDVVIERLRGLGYVQ